jgi:diguanylate cyclase (GGDEF)-like protein
MNKLINTWKLHTKLTLANSISILFVAGMLTLGLYWQIHSLLRHTMQERLQDILSFSAPLVDGDFHSLIRSPEDETGSFYRVISSRLKSIRDTSPSIERIYTLRQLEDGRLVYVVHDDQSMHADPELHLSIGQEYTHPTPLLHERLAAIPGPLVEDVIYTDEEGTFLSGYAPIYDQFRNLDGVLGIDIDASEILAHEATARQVALLIFLFTVPLSLLLGAWISRKLTAPVNDLMVAARRLGSGQFDQPVPVRNQDELGVLAGTFNQMAGQLQRSMQVLELEILNHKQAQKIQDTIYGISQAAISTDNMDKLYESIHTILGKLVSVENFYIALHDPATGLISFPYYIDQYDEKPAAVEPGHGLTGYVLRTGKPLLATPDIFDKLILQGELELVGTRPIDWLGVPLKVEHEIIGVMVAQSYQEDLRFSQENVDLFEFVSSQVAQTIHRKRADDSLNESNQRYYRLFEESPVSLWEEDFSGAMHLLNSFKKQGITDLRTFLASRPDIVLECAKKIKILDINNATVTLFKARSKENLLNNLDLVFCDESYLHFQDELISLAEGNLKFYQDTVNQTLDGQRIDVNMSWSVQPGYEHDFSRVIVTLVDITERRKNEVKLTYLSTHDALTGLYNRTYFDGEISRIESARQYPISIVMADVDDLKDVNDRQGHAAGDEMLKQAAKALLASFRSEDIVSRIGGDEFAIIMPATSAATAQKTIQRIKDNILKSNADPASQFLRLSLGTSTLEQTGSLEETLKQADVNMYLDKQNKSKH